MSYDYDYGGGDSGFDYNNGYGDDGFDYSTNGYGDGFATPLDTLQQTFCSIAQKIPGCSLPFLVGGIVLLYYSVS